MGERVDVDGEEGDGRLFGRSIRETLGEFSFRFSFNGQIHALSVLIPIQRIQKPSAQSVRWEWSIFGMMARVCCWARISVWGTLGEVAREMDLVFQRGRDWETKDPSEGWASG